MSALYKEQTGGYQMTYTPKHKCPLCKPRKYYQASKEQKRNEMTYTQGEWKATETHIFDETLVSYITCGNFTIAQTRLNLPENTVEENDANANLIVTAVNACQSVNPDNPLAAAESIKDMYEALKALWKAIKFHHLDEDSKFGVLYKNQVEQALAKVEGK